MSRRLTVEADGGSRGNPGVAGYGALVRDADTGALLAERAEPLGKQSNNVAEYRGLIAGLEAALAIDPVAPRCTCGWTPSSSSSRCPAAGRSSTRTCAASRCRPATSSSDFTAAGGSVRFTWIPRAENKDADALSNVAMDGRRRSTARFGGPSEVDEVPGEPAADDQPRRTGFDRARHADPGGARAPRRHRLHRAGPPRRPRRPRPGLNATGRAAGRRPPAGPWPASCRATRPGSSRRRCRGRWRPARPSPPRVGVDPVVDAEWDEQSLRRLGRPVDRGARRGRARRHAGAARRRRPTGRRAASRTTTSSRGSCPRGSGWSPQGGTSVVVCHRKPILVVLAHLLGLPHDRAWRLAAAPGSLTAVEVWDDGEVSVAFTNRT